MLGTIGEQGRMELTVISDAVNLASHLEGLTKAFGANIIVSDSALSIPAAIKYRYLGKVKVKGKQKTILVYEVCEGLPAAVLDAKLEVGEKLKEALELYNSSRFAEAKKIFSQLYAQNPSDKVLQLYESSCLSYMASTKGSSSWLGALSLSKDGALET